MTYTHTSIVRLYRDQLFLEEKPAIRAVASLRDYKWRSIEMNWDEVAGKWQQFKGSVKERWGRLNDDDLKVIDGKMDILVGKLQQRYGLTKEKAEEQVRDWQIPARQEQSEPKQKAS